MLKLTKVRDGYRRGDYTVKRYTDGVQWVVFFGDRRIEIVATLDQARRAIARHGAELLMRAVMDEINKHTPVSVSALITLPDGVKDGGIRVRYSHTVMAHDLPLAAAGRLLVALENAYSEHTPLFTPDYVIHRFAFPAKSELPDVPQSDDAQIFSYLDALRDSGEINMFSAPVVLQRRFGMTKDAARALFMRWAESKA